MCADWQLCAQAAREKRSVPKRLLSAVDKGAEAALCCAESITRPDIVGAARLSPEKISPIVKDIR